MSPSRRRRPVIVVIAAGLLAFAAVACSDRPVTPPPIDHAGPRGPCGGPAGAGTAADRPTGRAAICRRRRYRRPTASGSSRYGSPTPVQTGRSRPVSSSQPTARCSYGPGSSRPRRRWREQPSTLPPRSRAPIWRELPGGWSGGSQPTADGAVFAVSRQGTAVVITTNQRQTIGARRIAEQVIAALGL